MSLKIYNVLNRKKEEFIPLEENKVKMYACGITASGSAHIGHAYQAIVFDVIRRYLEYIGYEVTYVRNYTDVDDKIILKARELQVNPSDYAKDIIKKIDRELDALHIERPTIESRATEAIEDIIKFIEKLIEKGYAYSTASGDVFFRVSSFDKYGDFSNIQIENSISGVRKEVEPGKQSVEDFALWKNAKDDEIYWDSPWGKGRPGWHIECSAMSMKYLGETIDIHGGGKDLIFPHHENEIAQSETLTGKQFSRCWIHNGLIKVNGQKMSKSLNNGILLEDILKEYNYEVIRFTLLENNYKSDLNIVDGIFNENEKKIYHIYKLFDKIDTKYNNILPELNSVENKLIEEEFKLSMDNDFNTSLALANLLKYISEINKELKEGNIQKVVNIKHSLIEVYKVLGLLQQDSNKVTNEIQCKYIKQNNITKEEIEELINKRLEFKKLNNYNEADNIRTYLLNKGILLKDINNITEWDINFNR